MEYIAFDNKTSEKCKKLISPYKKTKNSANNPVMIEDMKTNDIASFNIVFLYLATLINRTKDSAASWLTIEIATKEYDWNKTKLPNTFSSTDLLI